MRIDAPAGAFVQVDSVGSLALTDTNGKWSCSSRSSSPSVSIATITFSSGVAVFDNFVVMTGASGRYPVVFESGPASSARGPNQSVAYIDIHNPIAKVQATLAGLELTSAAAANASKASGDIIPLQPGQITINGAQVRRLLPHMYPLVLRLLPFPPSPSSATPPAALFYRPPRRLDPPSPVSCQFAPSLSQAPVSAAVFQ